MGFNRATRNYVFYLVVQPDLLVTNCGECKGTIGTYDNQQRVVLLLLMGNYPSYLINWQGGILNTLLGNRATQHTGARAGNYLLAFRKILGLKSCSFGSL